MIAFMRDDTPRSAPALRDIYDGYSIFQQRMVEKRNQDLKCLGQTVSNREHRHTI